jgi:glutamate/aspartate transport system substrate-binding protein
LPGLAAQSQHAGDYEISAVGLSVEPYGIMVRKDDKAFKAVADRAMSAVYKSGQIKPDLRKVVPEAGAAQGHQPDRCR